MQDRDSIKKRDVAPPALAARVYMAKEKRDETVDLRQQGVVFTAKRPVTSTHDPTLEMILVVRVQTPIGRMGRHLLEHDVYKFMYFELLVKEAGRVYTVVQCHCQSRSHGSEGQVHVHRAVASGKNPQKQTMAWRGVTPSTPVSDAFLLAIQEMGIQANYQSQ